MFVSTRITSSPSEIARLKSGPTSANAAPFVTVRARARCGRHVVPAVDDLHDPPALGVHRRHHEHDRLSAQVELRQRVERVHVHPDDLVVFGIGKVAVVIELIDRRAPSLGLRDVRHHVLLMRDVNERKSEEIAVRAMPFASAGDSVFAMCQSSPASTAQCACTAVAQPGGAISRGSRSSSDQLLSKNASVGL